MIGVFDSGHGGLTVLRALVERFPDQPFVYLGDHRNAPYGNRSSEEIVALTRQAVEALFQRGCRLVVLGCNTATCVAARTLQRDWLPGSPYAATHNVLGIVAPTVEAATQTPWAVTIPQYPQKYNTDLIAVFGTTRTITSFAYPEEIRKRCPRVAVVQQICAELAGAIETGASASLLDDLVARGVAGGSSVPPPPATVHPDLIPAGDRRRQPRGLPRPPSPLSDRRHRRRTSRTSDHRQTRRRFGHRQAVLAGSAVIRTTPGFKAELRQRKA